MKRVVFVSRQRLTGRKDGSSAYLLDLARAVREAGMTPVLVQPAPSAMGRTPVARLSPDVDVFATRRLRRVWQVGAWLVSLDLPTWLAATRGVGAAAARKLGASGRRTHDRPLPYSVSVPWTGSDHRYVRRHLVDADVVVADYIFQTDAFANIAPTTPTAIVMHDLFSSRDVSGEAGTGREQVATIDARKEAALLARGSAVVTIQQSEFDWVRQNVPNVHAMLAPMAVKSVAAPQTGEACRLLFVGSGTAPNVVGLRWFLDHVWPDVRRACPDVRLDVVGSVRRAFPEPVQGADFLGIVDSLDEAYGRAGVVISPLLSGSGLKIKLIEAMGFGKAIVGTSVTVQGVEEQCRGAVSVADTAEGFAAAVVDLLAAESSRSALAARALAVARTCFSDEACHADFRTWLQAVTATENRDRVAHHQA